MIILTKSSILLIVWALSGLSYINGARLYREDASDCSDAAAAAPPETMDTLLVESTPTAGSTIHFEPDARPQQKDSNEMDCLTKIIAGAFPLRLFERFLISSELAEPLNKALSPHTLFVPWDNAFKKLSFGWAERLKHPMWRHHLKQFLLHHMYDGHLPLDKIRQFDWLKIRMMDGEEVEIAKKRNRVRINDVKYLAATAASDGKLYACSPCVLT